MDADKLKNLEPEQVTKIYSEYLTWARHHHVLIWTAAAFGFTFQIPVLLLFRHLDQWPYTIICGFSLMILFASYKLAEGNRRQWQDYKSVPNRIEVMWGIREVSNLDGQLNIISVSKVRAQYWRNNCYKIIAAMLVATVIVKWINSWPSNPTP